MRLRQTTALLILTLSALNFAKADEHPSEKGWYVGVDAGTPLSASSFSSFAPGGPYAGWTAGLLAGYSFNDFLGVEADLGLGRSDLAARQGCMDNNYYLGADDILYYAAPLGIDSWSVSKFKTGISYQRFGISTRLNLLASTSSRWALALSPRISLYNTSQTLYSLSGREKLRPASNFSRHFGYGGAIQLGYQISSRLSICLSSSITALTGSPLDGLPSHGHKANFIWENSLRLCFSFGSTSRPSRAPSPSSYRPILISAPSSSAEFATPAPSQPQSLSEFSVKSSLPECQFVYFEFDKWELRTEEIAKLEDILEALLRDEDLTLVLEGWCDRYGSDEVCEHISRLRAESVKNWFVDNGISPDRIHAEGKGRDTRAQVNSLARRVKVEAQLIIHKDQE